MTDATTEQGIKVFQIDDYEWYAAADRNSAISAALSAGRCDMPRTEELAREVIRLDNLINSPEIEDFLKGVRLEAAHQRLRWGDAHDREKSSENWFWLVGYLAGKALRATIDGNREKALHHCISSAAGLMCWHQAIKRDTTGKGIGQDADLEALAK